MSAYLVCEVNGNFFVEEKVFKDFDEYISEKAKGSELYSSKSVAECVASVSKVYNH